MAPRGKPFAKGRSGNPGGRPRVLAEIRELARAHAPDLLAELVRIAKEGESETARIAAIKELLDRGYGKAALPLVGADEAPLFPARVEIKIVDAAGRPRQAP